MIDSNSALESLYRWVEGIEYKISPELIKLSKRFTLTSDVSLYRGLTTWESNISLTAPKLSKEYIHENLTSGGWIRAGDTTLTYHDDRFTSWTEEQTVAAVFVDDSDGNGCIIKTIIDPSKIAVNVGALYEEFKEELQHMHLCERIDNSEGIGSSELEYILYPGDYKCQLVWGHVYNLQLSANKLSAFLRGIE
jgi:hypothetical protein